MNRIIQHLGRSCPCQSARAHVERLAEAARSIEATTGELCEVIVPTPNMVIEDGRRGVKVFVCRESDELSLDNLPEAVAAELRGLADSLNAAADALCAGGAA